MAFYSARINSPYHTSKALSKGNYTCAGYSATRQQIKK